MITISEASEFFGVDISTLRRWKSEDRIKSERIEGGHRRYDKNMLISLKNKQVKNIQEQSKEMFKETI